MKMNIKQTDKVWSDIKRRVNDFYHGFYNNSMAQTFCTEHLHRNGVNTWEQNISARMCTKVLEDVVLGWMTGAVVTCYAYCMLPTDMTSYYGKLFLKMGCPHKARRDVTVAEVFGCSCLDFHQTFLQHHYRNDALYGVVLISVKYHNPNFGWLY